VRGLEQSWVLDGGGEEGRGWELDQGAGTQGQVLVRVLVCYFSPHCVLCCSPRMSCCSSTRAFPAASGLIEDGLMGQARVRLASEGLSPLDLGPVQLSSLNCAL